MSTLESDLAAVLSVLLAIPLLAVVAFVLVDIVRRADLPLLRKLVYAAIVVFVLPAALLYLLSRPTSIVRHHDRGPHDWRADLVAELEAPEQGRPAVGPGERRQLVERVRALGS